jgi:hypothetical protein
MNDLGALWKPPSVRTCAKFAQVASSDSSPVSYHNHNFFYYNDFSSPLAGFSHSLETQEFTYAFHEVQRMQPDRISTVQTSTLKSSSHCLYLSVMTVSDVAIVKTRDIHASLPEPIKEPGRSPQGAEDVVDDVHLYILRLLLKEKFCELTRPCTGCRQNYGARQKAFGPLR